MKNLLNLFSLSIILSIVSISGFANNLEKNYINPENIVLNEEKIYLLSEEGDLEPLTAVYSDEKGLYILTQDEPESTEEAPLYTQDAQDPLVPLIDQEPLCAEDSYRELTTAWICLRCGDANPGRYRTCETCGKRKLPGQ